MPLQPTYPENACVDIHRYAEKVQIITFIKFIQSKIPTHWQHTFEIYLAYYQPFDNYKKWAWCRECQYFVFLDVVDNHNI